MARNTLAPWIKDDAKYNYKLAIGSFCFSFFLDELFTWRESEYREDYVQSNMNRFIEFRI